MTRKEYDFSDTNNHKISTKAVRFVECKLGVYKQTTPRNGTARFKQFTAAEVAEMNKTVDESPCTCVICTKRAENAQVMYPVGSMRSGKKRGHGEGRKLGDAE